MPFNEDNRETAIASTVRGARRRSRAFRIGAASGAAVVIAGGCLAMLASAGALTSAPGVATAGNRHVDYSFSTLDNSADLTFNQLLGISNSGTIAGYFGSGAAGHPNQGYQLLTPYGEGNYAGENYPGSVQTQVTGLNNGGVTVGFFSDQNNASQMNDNYGFYQMDGRFTEVNFPTGDNATPPVNQLLGVNDHNVAVGFYNDSKGVSHGYTYDIGTGRFTLVKAPGGGSVTAAAISDSGDIAGYYNPASGATDGFVTDGSNFTKLSFPGASMTMALGVNDSGEVVGVYTVGKGSSAPMHGFTWTGGGGFASVNDPSGVDATTVNGINDHGDLVGFYTDSVGNTDGFLATPGPAPVPTSTLASSAPHAPAPMPGQPASSQGMGGRGAGQQSMGEQTMNVSLQPMPNGTVNLGQGGQGLTAQVSITGLTPGSSHAVELRNGGTVLTQFSTLTAAGTGQANTTLTSNYTGSIPSGSRIVILNGAMDDGSVDSEQIADMFLGGGDASTAPHIQALDVTGDGVDYETPAGTASLTYNPAAQTVTVTVNAVGLAPGAHAAQIDIGSCASQGWVQYALGDLNANGGTAVINGVTSPLPASGMYLNILQGDSQSVLAGGEPAIAFRPLLCANI
jgi:hypothetical protein